MKGVVKGVIAGGIIAAIGIIILLIALGSSGWSMGEADFEMRTFTAEQDNSALDIEIGAGTLVTEFYDGDKVIIEYPFSDAFKISVSEHDGTVKFHSSTKWYKSFWGINKIPQTVIKMPQGTVFKIDLDMSAGTVNLADGNYSNVKLEMSAGIFKSGYVSCDNFTCDMSAGAVSIGETVCRTFECDLSAGSMTVNRLTATYTDIDISAGSVSVNLTGNKSEYAITTHISAGSCNVEPQTGSTEKTVNVHISAGSVKVDFGA